MPTIKRKLKETGPNGIEAKVKSYARARGIYVRKFVSTSNPGVPDDIFVFPHGIVVFIEFKSPGKKPTRRQELNLSEIIRRNGRAYVVDDIDKESTGLSRVWNKDYDMGIPIWHNGYDLIDFLLDVDKHVNFF